MYEGYLTSGPTIGDDKMVVIEVEFRKEGDKTITQTYRIDRFLEVWLKNIVRDKCESLNAVPESVQQGKVDISIVEPVVDVDREAYQSDFAHFQIYLTLEAAGLDVEQAVADLKKRLQANFKAEYLNLE